MLSFPVLVNYLLLFLLLGAIFTLIVIQRAQSRMAEALKGQARQIHEMEGVLMDLQIPVKKNKADLEQIRAQLNQMTLDMGQQSKELVLQARELGSQTRDLAHQNREIAQSQREILQALQAFKSPERMPRESTPALEKCAPLPTPPAPVTSHTAYAKAIDYVQQGYGSDVLVEQCGISRGEAELLLAMYRPRPASS